MSPVTSTTVVAVFSSIDQARNAVAALRNDGFPQDSISFVIRSDEDRGNALVTVRSDHDGAERALRTMEANGASDIDARVSSSRERGLVGHNPGVEPLSEDELRREREFYASGGHRVAGGESGTLWPHREAHDIGEDLVEAAAPEEPPRRRTPKP